MSSRFVRGLKSTVVASLFFATALTSYAQSCPLCINSVANSKQSFIVGLRHGILILLFPPLAICLTIGMMTYQRRNQYNQNDTGAPNE
jgi:hypothetical protein